MECCKLERSSPPSVYMMEISSLVQQGLYDVVVSLQTGPAQGSQTFLVHLMQGAPWIIGKPKHEFCAYLNNANHNLIYYCKSITLYIQRIQYLEKNDYSTDLSGFDFTHYLMYLIPIYIQVETAFDDKRQTLNTAKCNWILQYYTFVFHSKWNILPLANSISNTPMWPLYAAIIRGVLPCLSVCSKEDPIPRSRSATFQWPASTAHNSGVRDLLFGWWRLAPWSIRNRTTSLKPWLQDAVNATKKEQDDQTLIPYSKKII